MDGNMETPESVVDQTVASEAAEVIAPARPETVAPVWHTVVLVAAILAISWSGSGRTTGVRVAHGRAVGYAVTAAMELVLLGWVALGLWLRKVPFRSLFGKIERGVSGFFKDLGIAALFWIISMMVLGSLGLTWNAVEFATTHKGAMPTPGQKLEPSVQQKQTLQTLERMAPANGMEIACWVALCLVVGPVEEAIFRGYLQKQFTAWSRDRLAVGIVASAVLFGAAHGYEGLRSMVLLGAFGAMFGLLVWIRGGLRAGIFAHSAHDLIVGLILAAARARHLI
ncbi:MAG: CPBP family intramembrane metalloprotease [Terracidiphilus sp.]|nr:CPBP family intramembrane metalloprotease [Terracidiphilus sp.]